MVPLVARPPAEAWDPPALVVCAARRRLALFGVVALAAGLALSATYPAASEESSSMAMYGMAMDGNGAMASGTESITSDTCHLHQTGLELKGLDLNNTPYMIMGGKSAGMDMNGADAERGRRLQRDEAQLELHRSRAAPGRGTGVAGGRQQRAQRHRRWRRTAARPS